VTAAPLANFNPDYRVTLDVQRFETVQGDSFEALAAAHSRALGKLGGDIAAAITAESKAGSQTHRDG
jgi:hypothetical protein